MYRHLFVVGIFRTALVAALPLAAMSGTNAAAADLQVHLGAHTMLKVGEGDGVSPALTPAITTQSSGSTLIVFNSSYTVNLTPPTDTYSNAWTEVGDPVFYVPYGEAFAVTGYVALAARGGAHHTVRIAKPLPAGEISVPFVEILNAGVLQDVAQNYPLSGATITSDSVTTTGPATLVAFWWGDGGVKHMTAVPKNGFTVIESFLDLPDNSGTQAAVAVRQVNAAGTYNVSWSDNPAQGAILWLFAFQSNGEGDVGSGGDIIFTNGFN